MREKVLMQELVTIIEQRNAIVNCLDEDRQRRGVRCAGTEEWDLSDSAPHGWLMGASQGIPISEVFPRLPGSFLLEWLVWE